MKILLIQKSQKELKLVINNILFEDVLSLILSSLDLMLSEELLKVFSHLLVHVISFLFFLINKSMWCLENCDLLNRSIFCKRLHLGKLWMITWIGLMFFLHLKFIFRDRIHLLSVGIYLNSKWLLWLRIIRILESNHINCLLIVTGVDVNIW